MDYELVFFRREAAFCYFSPQSRERDFRQTWRNGTLRQFKALVRMVLVRLLLQPMRPLPVRNHLEFYPIKHFSRISKQLRARRFDGARCRFLVLGAFLMCMYFITVPYTVATSIINMVAYFLELGGVPIDDTTAQVINTVCM